MLSTREISCELYQYMPRCLFLWPSPLLLLLIYCIFSSAFAAFPVGAMVNIIFPFDALLPSSEMEEGIKSISASASCCLINPSVVIIALVHPEIDRFDFSIPCHRHHRVSYFVFLFTKRYTVFKNFLSLDSERKIIFWLARAKKFSGVARPPSSNSSSSSALQITNDSTSPTKQTRHIDVRYQVLGYSRLDPK